MSAITVVLDGTGCHAPDNLPHAEVGQEEEEFAVESIDEAIALLRSRRGTAYDDGRMILRSLGSYGRVYDRDGDEVQS